MKIILLNFMILGLLVLAYFTNIFEIFAWNSVFVISIILVLALLAVTWKVVGNPFEKKQDKDK